MKIKRKRGSIPNQMKIIMMTSTVAVLVNKQSKEEPH